MTVVTLEGETEEKQKLHIRVNEIPSIGKVILFGLQQMLISISSTLVVPYFISNLVCAGTETIALRVKLIAATFVTGGIATIAQTTFGLRLCILHGPSFAFMPPLLAYAAMPENSCNATVNDVVPKEEWTERLQVIQGSLFGGVAVMIFLGATGLVGVFAKCVGPITICPLLILLNLGTVPTAAEKMGEHWISIFEYGLLITLVIVLDTVKVPIPYFSFSEKKFKLGRAQIFGQFPYLIGVLTAWFICFIMTATNLIGPDSNARTDKNATMTVLKESPWFQVPYPLQFGAPKFSIPLSLGFVASTIACLMESIGDWKMCASISQQRSPPSASVNRGVLFEGFGCILAALMGVGSGVTTYGENIALMHITKVVSRITMQLAGVFLIFLGVFTKTAAILASIPDAVIGGVLAMGMSMISGVALGNLLTVDLRLTRNITIMGVALMSGNILPEYISTNPIHTGVETLDNTLNMLMSIKMLIGGLIAFASDNSIPGATREQRGFQPLSSKDEYYDAEDDGYAFPNFANRIIYKVKFLCYLPFMPSRRSLERSLLLSPSIDEDTESSFHKSGSVTGSQISKNIIDSL